MVAASDSAPQHAPAPLPSAAHHAPRPLPLFLDMVRRLAQTEPQEAARALAGLRAYASARRESAEPRDTMIRVGPMEARAAGTQGPIVLLVPSLINPAWIMDLSPDRSLLHWLSRQGFRVILLDWGEPGRNSAGLDLAGHVTERLLPAIDAVGEPVHLAGYCLGGVLATAAASLRPTLSLSLLATPWHFSGYGHDARSGIGALWAQHQAHVSALGLMPMELLQTAFWQLDPERTVRKFAAMADRLADDPTLMTFARLEDWANGGAPLTAAAGRDLFERLIRDDESGCGRWQVGGQMIDPGQIRARARQFIARGDRIAPAASASIAVPATHCPSGHVGMMVGSQARNGCWTPLARWLRSD